MQRSSLRAVIAARPPEITGVAPASGWKFETRALADDFRHFDVKALASERPTISIFDYIGDDGNGGGVSAKRVAGALRTVAGKPITVEMNSPGGNYFEGVAIYNLLRRHDAHVAVQILGIAASAASVIAMAGDTIEIAHNAEIMIHEARGLFYGTKSEMAEAIETLQHVDSAMVGTYAARSGRAADEFAAMIAGKDVYFRGQEAIDAGLADTLMDREAEMPVYAEADDFPTDQASLDKFLAEKNMPRAERRELFKALNGGASSPATVPARRADDGIEEPDLSALFKALSLN